jgi:hypothetical protein
MVVEVHVRYLAFSGDGQHECHSDKGNPRHSCTSLLTRMGVLYYTKADGNCGVCLEVSRKFFLVISCILHVVNASRWMNLTDICALYTMGHEVVPVNCCSRRHRILPASD